MQMLEPIISYPIDVATKQEIVVFKTPGADTNAVKEAVMASILLDDSFIEVSHHYDLNDVKVHCCL